MTRQPQTLAEATDEELLAMPSHIFVSGMREALNLSAPELANLLGVAPQTVWRWERDPDAFDSAREVDPTARRVLMWIARPNRPNVWPAPLRAGWPIKRECQP